MLNLARGLVAFGVSLDAALHHGYELKTERPSQMLELPYVQYRRISVGKTPFSVSQENERLLRGPGNRVITAEGPVGLTKAEST